MKHYAEYDCYRKILGIIRNLNTDSQKINAIKYLIYNQFETFTPSPSGDEDRKENICQ